MINADHLNVSRNVNAKPVLIAEIALDEIRQKALDKHRASSMVVDQRDSRLPLPLLCSRFSECGPAVLPHETARRRHATFAISVIVGW